MYHFLNHAFCEELGATDSWMSWLVSNAIDYSCQASPVPWLHISGPYWTYSLGQSEHPCQNVHVQMHRIACIPTKWTHSIALTLAPKNERQVSWLLQISKTSTHCHSQLKFAPSLRLKQFLQWIAWASVSRPVIHTITNTGNSQPTAGEMEVQPLGRQCLHPTDFAARSRRISNVRTSSSFILEENRRYVWQN